MISGSTLLCQFIEPVTFARCTFIFASQNITLGGYLDVYTCIAKIRAIEHTRKLASLVIIIVLYNYVLFYLLKLLLL